MKYYVTNPSKEFKVGDEVKLRQSVRVIKNTLGSIYKKATQIGVITENNSNGNLNWRIVKWDDGTEYGYKVKELKYYPRRIGTN